MNAYLRKGLAVILTIALAITRMQVKAGNGSSGTGNLSFSYDDTSLAFGEVQWRDSEGTWHTQTENGTVDATAVRIVYGNSGALANWTEFRIDGVASLSEHKAELESTNEFALDADKNYSFEHIQFVNSNPDDPGDPFDPGDSGEEFSGSVYFVWEGDQDAFCLHEVNDLIAGNEINYIPVADVKDDISGEPFKINNTNYYWVWLKAANELFTSDQDGQLTSTRIYSNFSDFREYLESDEEILRRIAIDPCGAVAGASTVCTNGGRVFRATIFDATTFEGIAFNSNPDD